MSTIDVQEVEILVCELGAGRCGGSDGSSQPNFRHKDLLNFIFECTKVASLTSTVDTLLWYIASLIFILSGLPRAGNGVILYIYF